MKQEQEDKNSFSFKKFGCIVLLFIFIILGFLIYTFISRPNFTWQPIINYLNNNQQIDTTLPFSLEEAKAIVEEEVNAGSDARISEEVITVLARDSFSNVNNLTAQIKEDRILMYFILDETEENDLYGLVELSVNESQNLVIEKIGTIRISIPSFLNKAILNSFLTYFTFGERLEEENLIYRLLSTKESFKAERISLEEGYIVLENIKFDLFE